MQYVIQYQRHIIIARKERFILTPKEKSALHKGHRVRMKQRFMNSNADSFQEHELLEMLLYFAIPYKDTNELSHLLINRFGSIENVAKADKDELMSYTNMTQNAVILLKIIQRIIALSSTKTPKKAKKISNIKEVQKILQDIYCNIDREVVTLVLLDGKNKITDFMTIAEGSEFSSELVLGEISKIANKRRINKLIIAHNHIDNAPLSTEDIVATKKAAFYLNGVNIHLYESFVVTGGKVIGINKLLESKK